MGEYSAFRTSIYAIVARIPRGRVMTYGQIAALVGSPRAARQVGQAAHWGPLELPWQRVVHKDGALARGYTTGGLEAHKRDLEAEDVRIDHKFRVVEIDQLLWWPSE